MAGSSSEESGVGRSLEGISNGQQRAGEALAEWRSSEQVENGITSTSPPYWDTDDDDCGPKPSELYGKYTWKIDKFSQINKRELRSNAFEVGGYKWYILIYPQGCDVCNHLSLFLCVANHDKLLPGWSHFAQFTIAVVNKDPKKSKYSDTLHRFWKKEHDWGWKKFMELSKVLDGFVDADTLIIKAQVQVIRERADRPFRCLDCQYRRELVRVYLSNVEQICRRFVEERRGRLGKLIEDKARWSSFCTFWLAIDQNGRRRMSREKSDSILKVVVKHFFIEKEVTSTLVMDSLYSGLKALESQNKSKKAKGICGDAEEPPMPIVRLEKDTFILVDDVLLLLERAALEPLPPKDEKGPQNRTKDGGSGEDFSKDSIERDERRLTELGRRTIEIFVLAHIFSKIEVAYQEAVALKRQEELIREEEAAWMAGSEQKAKRGVSEKEKKSKKKQAKQKRNNRKTRDKGREDKPQQQSPRDERKGFLIEDVDSLIDKIEALGEVSDVSDSLSVLETLQPDSDADTWEAHRLTEATSSGVNGLSSAQNGETKSLSVMDDSSSTCSTDSVPSVVMNGSFKGNSLQNQKSEKSPSRGKLKRGKNTGEVIGRVNDIHTQPNDAAGSCKVDEPECDVAGLSLQDRRKGLEQRVFNKVDDSLQKKPNVKDEAAPERPPKEKTAIIPSLSSPKSPIKTFPPAIHHKPDPKKTTPSETSVLPKSIAHKTPTQKSSQGGSTTERPVAHQVPTTAQTAPPMSRPLSAPLVPLSRPSSTTPIISMAQTPPLLSRSASSLGQLGPDPSPATQTFVPQSYRNAMMGNSVTSTSTTFSQPHLTMNSSHSYSQPPQSPMFLPQSSERPSFSFGMVNRDVIQNGSPWMDVPFRRNSSSLLNDVQNIEMYNSVQHTRSAGRQLADEFPHLDIINDLLDDEPMFQNFGNGSTHLNRQYTFPGDIGGSLDPSPSTSSCRFERTRSYHGEFQHGYGGGGGSSGGQFDFDFDLSNDMIHQPNMQQQPYVNGHIDGLIQNQWQQQMAGSGSDLSYGLRNMDSDGYPYHMPDYSNLTNGYTVYRP